MSDIVLRPRSATELVDAAFQLYRREPLQFIVALGLVYAPLVLVFALIAITGRFVEGVGVGATIVLGLCGAAVGVGVYIFAAGVPTILASDIYLGRSANVGRAFALVAGAFWRVLGAVLIAGLLLFVVILPFAVLSGLAGGIFPFFAVIGIFVGVVFLFVTLVFVKQVALLEQVTASGAVSRSGALASGYRWHILGTMLLVMLLNVALGGGAALAGSFLFGQVGSAIVQFVVTIIVYPLIGIVETLLYYDLRIRREGFDIEHLASSFAPVPAES